MASCSSPPSFIMLSLCTPPSLLGRELLFPLYAADHSSSCLGNKLCALLRPSATPPTNLLPPSFTVTLIHPETHHDRITHNTRDSEIWQSSICVDKYLLSQPIKQLFNSQFFNKMLYLSANLLYSIFVFGWL